MSKRQEVQEMFNLSNGVFLGVLKRGKFNEDFLRTGYIDSIEEIEQWREEIIIELYNEVIDEPFDEDMRLKKKIGITIEEQIGALEYMLSRGIDSLVIKNERVMLIRKLYSDLEHVKEFNDIVNGLQTEGEEQWKYL